MTKNPPAPAPAINPKLGPEPPSDLFYYAGVAGVEGATYGMISGM